ncbi:MAG: hypothetical protein ACREIE_09485, partial [Nitrospiraceae bacterium]
DTTGNLFFSYFEPPAVGFQISNASFRQSIKSVTALGSYNHSVVLEGANPGWTDPSTVSVSLSIPLVLEWLPEDAGSSESLKQFMVYQVSQERAEARHHRLGFLADTQVAEQFTGFLVGVSGSGWGLNPWGSSPWGDPSGAKRSDPLRVIVPTNHQICRHIRAIYEHVWAREAVNIVQTAWDVGILGTDTSRRLS